MGWTYSMHETLGLIPRTEEQISPSLTLCPTVSKRGFLRLGSTQQICFFQIYTLLFPDTLVRWKLNPSVGNPTNRKGNHEKCSHTYIQGTNSIIRIDLCHINLPYESNTGLRSLYIAMTLTV